MITEAIARSRVLLVIIGPQWLAAEGDGCRRLDRSDDPVRVELETAFRVDGFDRQQRKLCVLGSR